MAHRLTEDELARFRAAFANWDTTGEGTIQWRDMCMVLEFLGETPSRMLRALCERPDAEDERVDFDEFLTITVGPPWEATEPNEEEELNEAMEEFDDGNGYVPLRDVMRIVNEHMEESGYQLTDGELVDVYRQVLDGSLFATAGGVLAPKSMWRAFENEFADLRKGQRTEKIDSATTGKASCFPAPSRRKCRDMFARLRSVRISPTNRFRRMWSQLRGRSVDSAADRDRAGDDGESAGGAAQMINLTVVDLGGNQLMLDAVASTWSVQALHQHIETFAGVPVHRQFLSVVGDDGCRREVCSDDACLSKAGVVDGSTLLLAVKDEVKLDYKKFVSRLMDVDLDHARARTQIHGRGV